MPSATIDAVRLKAALEKATVELLAERNAQGFWEGELSSSALSTATAVTALAVARRESQISNSQSQINSGLRWLAEHQNADGGWGDTTKSLSNISTTTLCWAAFGAAEGDEKFSETVRRAERWLTEKAGSIAPNQLAAAIIARYGKDRTFSVPILTMCALAGRLGEGRVAWKHVIPLPFELAAFPHQLFAALRLPVVSYALPALIAIGQARHVHAPSRNPFTRLIRMSTRGMTLRKLMEIQPTNGGFLEATPLTSFVTMSLAASGQANHVVTQRGLDFLLKSQRADGSWPIDTNLATWCTTLAVNGLDNLLGEITYACRRFEQWPPLVLEQPALIKQREAQVIDLVRWLLGQQHKTNHPYTHAAPGGWAWTDLPGGVPDADDTAGALLALRQFCGGFLSGDTLEEHGCKNLRGEIEAAGRAGVRWLVDLQNTDGGIPTFCRGWGKLQFDRSSPDLTAHALRAWWKWTPDLEGELYDKVRYAIWQAEEYLRRTQRPDGSWVPLWFGNENAQHDENPVYGTTRVLLAPLSGGDEQHRKGLDYLANVQNEDGSWGGAAGVRGSIEETGLAIEAIAEHLIYMSRDKRPPRLVETVARGLNWLLPRIEDGTWREPSPIGFYFAKLWYFERLYPMVFTVGALRAATTLLLPSEE